MLPIWSCAKETHKKTIYTLQNRSLKTINKLPVYYSTSALYGTIERNILNVTRMSFKFLALHVYQCLNNEIHHNMVFNKLNTRQTRAVSRGRLRLPEIQTTRYGLEGKAVQGCKNLQ